MKPNIALLLIGILFFAAGVYLLLQYLKNRKKCTVPSSAEVVDYYEDYEHNHDDPGQNSCIYYPIFRYCFNGRWYDQRGKTGSGRRPFEIGEHVEILCDPEDPANFIVTREKFTPVAFSICILIGVGILLLAFHVIG